MLTIGELQAVYDKNRRIYSATIELCSTCNWNCKYCYLESHNEKGLPTYMVKDVLMQLRELGCFDLTFTGGEIFTRCDVMELIQCARQLGFSVTLMTNLSMVDYKILDQIKKLNVERIECSLFSLNPFVHDDFVESDGSFVKLYDNLFYCKKIGIEVMIAFHPLTINRDELLHDIEFVREFGFLAKYDCRVLPKNNCDKSTLKYCLSDKELVDALRVVDKEMGVEYLNKLNEYICESTHTNVVITPVGDVKLCSLLGIVIGNIKEKKIREILSDPRKTKEIDMIRETNLWDLKKECRECKLDVRRSIC